MLMFQLYPKFVKTNIPSMIGAMMNALALRPPQWEALLVVLEQQQQQQQAQAQETTKNDSSGTPVDSSQSSAAKPTNAKLRAVWKRLYYDRYRELIAAQAKTLSFLTYLLRGFSSHLKPHAETLATNVVSLMTHCPKESVSTRKELLVATRHLLNHAEFRIGFASHLDALLDERILLGVGGGGGSSSSASTSASSLSSSSPTQNAPSSSSSSSRLFVVVSEQTLLRPLAYTTLSDLVQQFSAQMTMRQLSRVVLIFSRVLHDWIGIPPSHYHPKNHTSAGRRMGSSSSSSTGAGGSSSSSLSSSSMSTQYAAVRTLFSVVDIIYNKTKQLQGNNNNKSSTTTTSPAATGEGTHSSSSSPSTPAAAAPKQQHQTGRSILVRILRTLVDKLYALVESYPSLVLQGHASSSFSESLPESTETKATATSGTTSSVPVPTTTTTTSPNTHETTITTTRETEEGPSRMILDIVAEQQVNHPNFSSSSSSSWSSLSSSSYNANRLDSIREIQSMVRAIVVNLKTVITYISTSHEQSGAHPSVASPRTTSKTTQGDDSKPSGTTMATPAGATAGTSTTATPVADTTTKAATTTQPTDWMVLLSTEEPTNTCLTLYEMSIVRRYIRIILPVTEILQEPVTTEASTPAVMDPTKTTATVGASTGNTTNQEQYRDALTYFAASFARLDGTTLRLTLGQEMDCLVDGIMDDSMAMVIPRHWLACNSSTSYHVCSIFLEYLVNRMEELSVDKYDERLQNDEARDFGGTYMRKIIYLPSIEKDDNESGSLGSEAERQIQRVLAGPHESYKRRQQASLSLLQCFERVLKSLASFPENEYVIRKQLKRMVVVSFRAAMEHVPDWPDANCMLLRYIFRSISAGKFEESYKELLPLIPAVLNGLYRVMSAALSSPGTTSTGNNNSNIAHTAIELCLTIPARLSSLLPHLNLLLRVIVPALDSDSGDLVNLG